MKKPWQIIALLLLLGILPSISWFYLKGGLNYRLKALEELKVDAKITLPAEIQKIDSFHVLLVALDFNPEEVEEKLQPIQKHYQDVASQVLFLNLLDTAVADGKSRFQIINATNTSFKQQLLQTNFQADLFLLNENGELLYSYDSTHKSDLGKLVKHIAYALPPTRKKEVKFEREKEK